MFVFIAGSVDNTCNVIQYNYYPIFSNVISLTVSTNKLLILSNFKIYDGWKLISPSL